MSLEVAAAAAWWLLHCLHQPSFRLEVVTGYQLIRLSLCHSNVMKRQRRAKKSKNIGSPNVSEPRLMPLWFLFLFWKYWINMLCEKWTKWSLSVKYCSTCKPFEDSDSYFWPFFFGEQLSVKLLDELWCNFWQRLLLIIPIAKGKNVHGSSLHFFAWLISFNWECFWLFHALILVGNLYFLLTPRWYILCPCFSRSRV